MIFTCTHSIQNTTIADIPVGKFFRCYEEIYFKIDSLKSLRLKDGSFRDNETYFGKAPANTVLIHEVRYADLFNS